MCIALLPGSFLLAISFFFSVFDIPIAGRRPTFSYFSPHPSNTAVNGNWGEKIPFKSDRSLIWAMKFGPIPKLVVD